MADINVNVQYDYSIGILGNFSGGSVNVGGPTTNAVAPHPVAVTGTGDTVNDLSAIALGGFQGLNN